MTQRTWPKRPNVDLQSSCTDHGADHSADHSAYHGADHGADHDRTGHDPRHLLQAMTGWYQSFLEALVVIPGWVGNYSKLKQYFNYLRILNKKIKFLFHACSTIFFVLGVGGQCLYNYIITKALHIERGGGSTFTASLDHSRQELMDLRCQIWERICWLVGGRRGAKVSMQMQREGKGCSQVLIWDPGAPLRSQGAFKSGEDKINQGVRLQVVDSESVR